MRGKSCGAERGAGRQLEREIRRMDSACWCACALRSLLAFSLPGWLAFNCGFLQTSVGQRYLSPSVLFFPAVFLSPGFTRWIPPKILLPLTIMMISKQSHRMSRIYFRFHSASSALSFHSPGERLPWSEVPVLAPYAALLKSASLLSDSENSFLINYCIDEMCRCRRRFSTLSAV